MQQPDERSLPVTIACWVAILWSALGGIVSALRLTRVVDAETIYLVAIFAAKIACAVAILRGVRSARITFLVLYLADTLIIGPYFQWEEIVDDRLGGTYVIAFVFFFGYWFALAPPSFDGLLRHRAAIARFFARVFLAVSFVLVAAFIARAVLDLYAAAFYRPASAEIVAADVRDADVSTHMERDSSTGRERETTTVVTYDPKITFRYVVDGKTYERTGFATFGSTLSATFSPAKVRDKYLVGTKQTCLYDPINPSRAVLEVGVSPYYAFAFFAVLLWVIARSVAEHVLREK